MPGSGVPGQFGYSTVAAVLQADVTNPREATFCCGVLVAAKDD
jgi:hypothetical protein